MELNIWYYIGVDFGFWAFLMCLSDFVFFVREILFWFVNFFYIVVLIIYYTVEIKLVVSRWFCIIISEFKVYFNMINVCNMLDIILKCIINVYRILVYLLFKMFKNKFF